jgi:hypothetical protein
MDCESCKKSLNFRKEYRENILDKYLLVFEKNNYHELDPKIYVLFENLITYIKENDNLNIFWELNNRIDDEIIIACENCGFINKIYYTIIIADEFISYISRYIDFIYDNIITKFTNKRYNDFSIYLDEDNYTILFDNLPNYYEREKFLLKKLYRVRNITSRIEKGGNGQQIIEWILEQFKIQVFGIIITLLITGSITKIKELVKSIEIKKEIKKRIKRGKKYWKDINLDDIKKYITIPKKFHGRKEELVEQILELKFEEYKNDILEKLQK